MKIVSIVGKKNTGKTSLTVKIIKELTKRGYNVASIKHSHHTIEMDKENTDTWKHKQAGANLVVGVGSTTFFNSRKEHDLNRILYLIKHFGDYDYIIIEGYKTYNYPKIITSPELKDEYTIEEVNSFTITDEEISELADTIENKSHDIIDTLFANNCGYNDGEEIASQIRAGNLTTDDLDTTHSYMSIDGKVIGLNRFVSNYIKQSLTGVINTLNLKDYGVEEIGKIEVVIPNEKIPQKPEHGKIDVEINRNPLIINQFTKNILINSIKAMIKSLKTPPEVKDIIIEITNIDNDLNDAIINININNNDLKINEFTQGIVKETIYAIIDTLKTTEKINEIKIKITE